MKADIKWRPPSRHKTGVVGPFGEEYARAEVLKLRELGLSYGALAILFGCNVSQAFRVMDSTTQMNMDEIRNGQAGGHPRFNHRGIRTKKPKKSLYRKMEDDKEKT